MRLATKGQLLPEFRQFPQNKGQPFSRPTIETGTAHKTVYLSKAQSKLTQDQMERALAAHVSSMRRELQRSGKLVTGMTKTLSGAEGDCRIIMTWSVLGEKRTKHWRKAQDASRRPAI